MARISSGARFHSEESAMCCIRVSSKAELKARIELYLQEVNEEPVVFKWKYKLETLEQESIAPSSA